MRKIMTVGLLVAGALFFFGNTGRAAEFVLEESPDGVTVKLDGELFTRYLIDSGDKPILWPIIGPTGKPITRAYPMGNGPAERKDHPHHRSLWFTHGDVNKVSYWHESPGHGKIVHRKFEKVQGGTEAIIVTANEWVGRSSEKVLDDQRTLVMRTDGESRLIDFDITLRAGDKPVTLGDTKEGSFGVRVAGTMKVESPGGGHIVNSQGDKDLQAWGKKAAWVDYHGPLDDQTVGIAILNHPSSFRFPTNWHVRTYGLFAANPFGWHDFMGKDHDGTHVLKAGESITLRYRVVLHKGDHLDGQIAEAFQTYAAVDPSTATGK